MSNDEHLPRSIVARIGLVLGPLLAVGLWLPVVLPQAWAERFLLDASRAELNSMAAVTALMAVWWMTEAVHMAATALLPLALFPLLGILPGDKTAAEYGHHLVFLFLGGFLIALAVEESGLHRRIALMIVAAMGDHPRRIVAGFMIATALLSMWISNTATTLMMLPIGASVLLQADHSGADGKRRRNLGVALMLGIAYAASIGGVGTLIGTPPNIAFKGIYESEFPNEPTISFFNWMMLAVPFSLVFLVVAWLLLVRVVFPLGGTPLLGGNEIVRKELRKLGPVSTAEVRMAIIFVMTALLWILREPWKGIGWGPWLVQTLGYATSFTTEINGVEVSEPTKWVNDGTSALFMAVICFAIPSGTTPGKALMTWNATKRLPWGILLLFGGGLALAAGMESTGLDAYLGGRLSDAIATLPNVGKAALLAFGMTWLTELTSNLASVQMLMPVLASAAKTLKVPPLVLMIPATLSASCAFMLPVATPPNAIVYSSGRVRMADMIRAGIVLNLVGIVLVVLAVWLLGRLAFGAAAAF